MREIHVIDSHTCGEPTRTIISGGPDLGRGTMPERLQRFRECSDNFRSAVVNEPRGSEVFVGAFLCEPSQADCTAGVIFFNNVGYLGMCGHGTIGIIATLAYLDRIRPGEHRIDTPVGIVTATLYRSGQISVENVASYRKAQSVTVDVPGIGKITGDVAWGGNWFYLVEEHGQELTPSNVGKLTELAWQIRQAVNAQGYPDVDHVELVGPAQQAGANSRNFVLCPGKAYDRSPCGTGTSAKLACLAADGKLAEKAAWVQESILGSTFTGRYRWIDQASGQIAPTIYGNAYITAEATLLLEENDPFCWGIP